ncbi:MAG: hypothetical protein ACRDD1_06085 [Planctomycetia bacterium]
MDADGDFIIAWHSNFQDGSSTGVYAQRYNGAGVAQGGEFPLHFYTTSNQEFPELAFDANGDFVATWSSHTQDGDVFGVYARRFHSNGVPKAPEFKVNKFTTGDQVKSTIAMEANGDFVVAWQSNGQDGSGYGVYARRYTSTGDAKETQEFPVNTFTTGAQNNLSVVVDPDGDFVVAWQSNNQDGDGYGVYARRYTTDVTATPPILSVDTPPIRNQGEGIPLSITASLVDLDGSESLAIVISGLQAGTMLSAGTPVGENAFRLTPAQLVGLTITLPTFVFGTQNYTVTATATESAIDIGSSNPDSKSTVRQLTVTVNQLRAGLPVVTAQPADGIESTTIPLSLTVSKQVPSSPETLTVVVTGLPTGAVLLVDGQPVGNNVPFGPAFGTLAVRPEPGFAG